jgi:hypothetical protein
MPDVNINNFRCVPLDILQNVDKNGNIGVEVTNDSTELRKISDEVKADILASGQIKQQAFNAKTQENIIILISVLSTILIIGILFYIGFGNLIRIFKNEKYIYGLLGILIGGSIAILITLLVVFLQ